jgi:hypothetical protein
MGTEQVVAVRPAPYDSLGAWYPAASAVDGGWAACWRSAGTIECQKLAGDATTVGTPTTVTGYPDSALSVLQHGDSVWVAWEQGSRLDTVYVQRLGTDLEPAGGPWTIADSTYGDATQARLLAWGDSLFAVSWGYADGLSPVLQRLGTDGAPVGPVVVLPHESLGSSSIFAPSVTNADGFYVFWEQPYSHIGRGCLVSSGGSVARCSDSSLGSAAGAAVVAGDVWILDSGWHLSIFGPGLLARDVSSGRLISASYSPTIRAAAGAGDRLAVLSEQPDPTAPSQLLELRVVECVSTR